MIDNLRLQLKDSQTLYIQLKKKHNEEIDEFEERWIIELNEERERASWEKWILENDITILHKNLDVETKFNWELSIEN